MPISDYLKNMRAHVGHALILMPATAALIFNDEGELLLQRRSDNGLWGLPGGAIDPGEDAALATMREVYEETGLKVKPERLVAVIKHRNTYPNGDEIEVHISTFRCKVRSGKLESLDGESLELRYFNVNNMPESKMLEPFPKEIFDFEYEACYFAWNDAWLLQGKQAF